MRSCCAAHAAIQLKALPLPNAHSWLPFQGRHEIRRLCRHRNSTLNSPLFTLNSQLSALNSICRASGSLTPHSSFLTPHSSLNEAPHSVRLLIQKLIFSPRCTLRIISCLALRLMPAAPLFITVPLPAANADSFGRRVPASMRFVMFSSSSLA